MGPPARAAPAAPAVGEPEGGRESRESRARCCGVFCASPAELRRELGERLAEAGEDGRAHWRVRLVQLVDGPRAHLALALLLVLDTLVLFCELMLEAHYPDCAAKLETACAEAGTCAHDCATCLEDPHWMHGVHTLFFSVTMTILCIFELVSLLLWLGYGARFWASFINVLDIVVVSVAIALEGVFFSLRFSDTWVGGLLIVLRFWRFLRVGHAFGTEVHELDERQFKKEEHELKQALLAATARVGQLERVLLSAGLRVPAPASRSHGALDDGAPALAQS
jgi:hypothetical protein